ncbi:DUF1801 domain-containing protein [Luteolibacter sp. LG18]|uniref:iron chaperone n=1 Tax=Luteolibacter sp. LG18 TaxID=2819286 RepID=UPI002B2C4920|nr:hypothetical protein llg_34710 [Luteolibacter sp. LG18]
MGTPRFQSIEDYVTSQDPVKEKTLRRIIGLILTEFPELEAKIAWNLPMIHRQGQYIAGLAAYKRHLTFAPWSAEVMAAFKERLEKFVVFKNCFQIPVDWEVDGALITDLVKARLEEL